VPPYRRPVYIQRVFFAKCLRIFKAVGSLELNPANLFSKPVGSSLIFGEPAALTFGGKCYRIERGLSPAGTGTGKEFLAKGFRDAMFEPGQPLDAAKYYLILPDAIGLGGSSKPSDGLHDRFPRYG
jgi:hypothetical protein